MVAEGGVAVIVAEAEADEADEFGAFDGFCRVGRQDFRQDVLQVVPEIHGSGVGLKRMGGSWWAAGEVRRGTLVDGAADVKPRGWNL